MMSSLFRIVLFLILAASLAVSFFPGVSYSQQNREVADSGPSTHFPLGTDELGRDRLTRLLYATRVSLLLAGISAAAAISIAFLVGGAAGYFGGWCDACVRRALDLMLSLPWLFLLLAARALLPLNVEPITSLIVTYALLAVLGWAAPARVVRAGVRGFRDSDFVLQARAQGSPEWRVLLRHMLPNLRPVLLAQFWTTIPVFILAEANLGFLGLSAGEPLPTWGTLLRELQNPLLARPETYAPAAAIALSLFCFKFITPWGGSQV
ncbi:MAG TPA: ABC transporter permease [Bryobacteraceae bacterium]|nr:ABC transporter permease [Bryobacteraceae bacterium]